jgi:hypothetical protein
MDYGLLNALGITVMAVLGLWAFYAASGKPGRKRRKPDDREAG